eukprot:6342377-Pyramimonas_sp.AAC.1
MCRAFCAISPPGSGGAPCADGRPLLPLELALQEGLDQQPTPAPLALVSRRELGLPPVPGRAPPPENLQRLLRA